ncbi:hypothetical protein METHPM2_1760009 [Pseudomonas sp. PM2]
MGWGLILIAVNQPMHVQTAPTTSGASPGADQSSERNAQSNEDPMWELACLNASQLRPFCRSELAREKLTGAAFIQRARVIVDVFREQARSYTGR